MRRVQGSLRSGQAALHPSWSPPRPRPCRALATRPVPPGTLRVGGGAARAGRPGPAGEPSSTLWLHVVASKPSGPWTRAPSRGQARWRPRDSGAAGPGTCLLQPKGESLLSPSGGSVVRAPGSSAKLCAGGGPALFPPQRPSPSASLGHHCVEGWAFCDVTTTTRGVLGSPRPAPRSQSTCGGRRLPTRGQSLPRGGRPRERRLSWRQSHPSRGPQKHRPEMSVQTSGLCAVRTQSTVSAERLEASAVTSSQKLPSERNPG